MLSAFYLLSTSFSVFLGYDTSDASPLCSVDSILRHIFWVNLPLFLLVSMICLHLFNVRMLFSILKLKYSSVENAEFILLDL